MNFWNSLFFLQSVSPRISDISDSSGINRYGSLRRIPAVCDAKSDTSYEPHCTCSCSENSIFTHRNLTVYKLSDLSLPDHSNKNFWLNTNSASKTTAEVRRCALWRFRLSKQSYYNKEEKGKLPRLPSRQSSWDKNELHVVSKVISGKTRRYDLRTFTSKDRDKDSLSTVLGISVEKAHYVV